MMAGLAGWEANDVVENIYENPTTIEKGVCPGNLILAYTETDKYICECVGVDCPCIKTEEILSELG